MRDDPFREKVASNDALLSFLDKYSDEDIVSALKEQIRESGLTFYERAWFEKLANRMIAKLFVQVAQNSARPA